MSKDKERPTTITCATDAELIGLYDKLNYPAYWKDLIQAELQQRGIDISQQPPTLPHYAVSWV